MSSPKSSRLFAGKGSTNDKQSAFRDEQETGEDEDEELCFVDPLDVHEVWFTESPCGHHGYE